MARMELSSSKTRVDLFFIALYVLAIVLANYLVTEFGQAALVWTAFWLIPFDLVVRDLLQDRWQGNQMRLRMSLLIIVGGLISVLTSTGSMRVNLASFTAFTVAGFIDAATYQWMIRYGRIFRINMATAIAAVTDSIVFPLIAFDEVLFELCVYQAMIKMAGGAFWSLLMFPLFKRRASDSNIKNHSLRGRA